MRENVGHTRVDAPPEGVEPLDHTADVGFEVHAPTPEALFERAALGAVWLAGGSLLPEGEIEGAPVELEAEDAAALLRSWLREVLFRFEVEGFALRAVQQIELDLEGARLGARVRGCEAPPNPEREIKGVTWHGLELVPDRDGWRARVIFDV